MMLIKQWVEIDEGSTVRKTDAEQEQWHAFVPQTVHVPTVLSASQRLAAITMYPG